MTINCPGCGSRYEAGHLAPKSVFQCSKCGGQIVVPDKSEGEPAVPARDPVSAWKRTSDPGPGSAAPDSGWGSRAQLAAGPAMERARARLAADPGLSLFVIGVVLLVFAYMMAFIDQAAVSRAQAHRSAAEMRFERANDSLLVAQEEAQLAVLKAQQAISDAQEAEAERVPAKDENEDNAKDRAERMKKLQDELAKAQKNQRKAAAAVDAKEQEYRIKEGRKLTTAVSKQEFDADMNRYWYAWLQLPGFLCLFLGCIAFLGSTSLVKRITGAVLLIVSMGVLVLLYIVPGTMKLQEAPSRRAVPMFDQDRPRIPGDTRKSPF